jgi:excisionase family DNA binding protein
MTTKPPSDYDVPAWLSPARTALYAGVSVSSVTRAIHDGSLRSVKHQGRRLIHREWIDWWLLTPAPSPLPLQADDWLAATYGLSRLTARGR